MEERVLILLIQIQWNERGVDSMDLEQKNRIFELY